MTIYPFQTWIEDGTSSETVVSPFGPFWDFDGGGGGDGDEAANGLAFVFMCP